LLLQNIRNEPWIQIIVVIALFIIGIIIAISLVKSYNKYQQKLEIFSEVKDSSFKLLIILNLVWLIFSLLGIFISFFLFNFNFFYVLNIIDILMIIANIIIGTLLYMKFYNKDYKNSLVTITIIQIILYGIGIFFNLFFKVFLEAIETIPLEEQGIYLLAYIVGVGVTISITIFFAKLGSKIQLVYELTNMIALIAVIPGLIYISVNFLINPTGVYYEVSQIVTTVVIVSIIITIILKKVSYRTIPSRDIEEMKVLEKGEALLDIKNLKVHYPLLKGVLRKQIGAVKAVDGVSFSIKAGETVGLVGESGCGKTTVAMAILGLVEKKSGEILLEGEPLPTDYTSKIRKTIQIVFQDPDASLNPQLKVVDLIAEPIKNIYGVTNKTKLRKQVLKLLEEVSLKKEHLDRYPHEFSGGQKQRIVIARALACNPELIILDEPTSALDVSVQAQILNLLRDLQKTYHYGFLFITHDLSVVYHIADTIAVMYLGKIVEIGDKKLVFSNPTHPYTKALLASRSEVSADDQEIKFVLSGEVPSPIAPPPGCSFHPRCYAESYNELCRKEEPHMIKVEDGHYIWCVNEEVLRESHEFVFE
jgi:peptide/nickel transport system ATP-binding protein/oligopeptide transport system ATP-binding protein